jgi:hypothetical protein
MSRTETTGTKQLARVDLARTTPQKLAEYETIPDKDFDEKPIFSGLSPQLKRGVAIGTRDAPLLSGTSRTAAAKLDIRANASISRATPQASVPLKPAPSSNKGRPKGWKPGMSYAALRAGAPPGSASSTTKPPQKPRDGATGAQGSVTKRRGRPPKAPSPPPLALFASLRPAFLIFTCEWKGCPAELHNLETLRRHVDAVHCKSERAPRRCQFSQCASVDVQRFDSLEQLQDHIEAEHIIPYAWHLGDGPKVTPLFPSPPAVDDELPDYLFDNDGNQVTPSVKHQRIETFTEWQARRRKLKETLQRMNDALPDPESSDESPAP